MSKLTLEMKAWLGESEWRYMAGQVMIDHTVTAVDLIQRALLELGEGSCPMCGGRLVWIRGRYPKTPPRSVCPTCLADRLAQIHELSSPSYGVAYRAAERPVVYEGHPPIPFMDASVPPKVPTEDQR